VAAVGDTSVGIARDRLGDVGGRRKCRGTAVGDPVADWARDQRRPLGDPCLSRVVSGEDGLLWDLGTRSGAFSVAGGEVDRLRDS